MMLIMYTPSGAIMLIQGVDYTLSGLNITTTNAPAGVDSLSAWYRY